MKNAFFLTLFDHIPSDIVQLFNNKWKNIYSFVFLY